ncbi:hypothetical protein DLD82_16800 [Methanospirillum stamsii]|uniref:Uncharacterized protein n=1 Tax=Methanospirillum stamsii TaxID=1277351 RepID=A0A2V2MP33_9EURY|nr:hypothetical protein DLD82_16800 [Methanospirillum stamsii]
MPVIILPDVRVFPPESRFQIADCRIFNAFLRIIILLLIFTIQDGSFQYKYIMEGNCLQSLFKYLYLEFLLKNIMQAD